MSYTDKQKALRKKYGLNVVTEQGAVEQAAPQQKAASERRYTAKQEELRKKYGLDRDDQTEVQEEDDGYEAALKSYLQQEKDAKQEKAQLRDATFKDLTVNSFNRGFYNSRLGEETFQELLGAEGSNADKYRKILEGEEYQFDTDNWWEKAVSGTAEQLGQWLNQWSNPQSLTAATAGAGTAWALGKAGPQALVPEEIITVPATAAAGLRAGSTVSNLQIEAGHAYNEMTELGIDPETASAAAFAVGGANAAIEGLQLKKLEDAYKVLVRSNASDNLIKRIGKVLAERGVDVAKETAQEVVQETVTMGGVTAANLIDKGAMPYTGEEMAQRLGETALSSALTFGLMNVPAGAMQIAADTTNARAQAKAEPYLGKPDALINEVLALDPENQIAKQLQGESAVNTDQLMQLMWERDRLQRPEMPAVQKRDAETASPQSPTATAPLAKGSQETAAVTEGAEETVALERASEKYGAQAGAMIHTYQQGQDVRQYDMAYQSAYEMGKSGVNRSYAMNSASTAYLTETQRELAYEAGKDSENAVKVPESADEYDISDEGKALYKVTDAAGNVTYEVAEPGKVVSVEGNDMVIEVGDGVEAASADISYATEGEAVLYHTVATVANTADEANALLGGYAASGLTHEQYAAGIRNAYDAGRFNEPKGAVMKQRAVKRLPADVAEAAYAAGRSFAAGSAEKAEATVKAKIPEGAKANKQGTIQYMEGSKRSDLRTRIKQKGKTLNAKQEAAIQTAEMLSQMTGVNFIVYESYRNAEGKLVYSDRSGEEVPAPNGFYYDGTGDIYIDLNAGNSGDGLMLYTMAHELTHFIKSWSPKKYRILANALMDEYSKTEGKTVERLTEEQILKAAGNGRAISEDVAYEEVVANSMEQILESGRVAEFMAEIKQQDKSLWQKIKQWFKDFADKLRSIREAYAGAKPDSAEAKIIAGIDGALERLEPIFAEALAEAGDNYQSAATKNTADDSGVTYQIREQFYSELDAWNGKSDKTFQVGTTSEALKSIGVKDTGIIWHSRKIAKILREHEAMTRDVIKQVPQILENPVAVLASKNSESRIAIFGTVNDENGVPVTAILELRPTNKGGQVMNLNVIASAYGKDNAKRFVESSGLIYLDKNKKRTESWMQGLGLQLPSDTTTFGSIGRVSYPNNEVKIDSVPYSQYMQSSERKFSFRAADESDGLERAEQMETAGVDSETIRRETGLFRSYDGMWRVEMNDSAMNLADEISNYMKLGELVEYPELFAAYPDMKNMTVVFHNLKGRNGSYSYVFDEIDLDYSIKTDREKLKSSLLHEIQHAIQHREGFARGANVRYWEGQLKDGFDSRRKNVIEQAKRLNDEFESIKNAKPEFFSAMMELDSMTPTVPRGAIDWNTLQQIEEDPVEWQVYDQRRESIEEQYGDDSVWEFTGLLYKMRQMETEGVRTAVTLYYETAGEIEARDVADRMNMTAQQRRETRPDIDYEDVVFTEEGRRRYSDRDYMNPDIRYSDRDPAAQKTAAALSRENKHLKEDVKNLRELVQLQNKVTGGTKVVRADVDKMAKLLMKNNDVKGDYRELTPLLMNVYEYIARNDEVTWEGVVERSRPTVEWLMEHVRQTDKLDPYAQEILDVLKGSSVRFNETQKKEATYHSDGWGKYRNSIIGAIGVSDKASTTLDQLWAELAESYPATFDASIPDAQQPAELAEIIEELRNMKELDDGYSDALFEQSLMNDVYDGYWRVSTLHTVADKYQAQIDQLKHRHFKEMKESKARLDSTVKRLKEEKKDALKQLRKKKDEQIKETTERYKESRAEAVNKRRLNAAKKKIRRVISQLDKLLTQGTKERNVKEELKGFVAKALHSAEAFFADEYSDIDMIRNGIGTQMTPTEAERAEQVKEIVDEIDEINGEIDALMQLPSAPQIVEQIDALQTEVKALEQKAKYRINTYLSDVMIRERARLSETKLTDVITELMDAYKELENADGYLKGVYDEYVYAAIENKKKVFGGTVVKNMDLSQLEELHDLYSMVLHTVRNANKAFASARNESIASLAERVVSELGMQHRRKKLHPKGTKTVEKFSWNNEKPVYAFMRMGSEVLGELYEEIRKGEDVWAKNMEEAREYYLAAAEKYNLKSWDMDTVYEFVSASGDKFGLTIDQMMSIYAYAKREQAADHLRKGGIVISDDMEVVIKKKVIPMKYESEDATAYDISDVTLQEIVKTLKEAQPEAIGFADEMQAYLSDEMGAKGNEVSLKLYGVKLFKDQNYFPLKSADQYLERAREQQERTGKIKNKGFTKDTVQHASNPIVLNGFLDTWAGHVNEMSMYHAFTLPMEDFYRVYNYSTKHIEGESANAVIPMLQNTHGRAATNYIDDLLKDLNGGARADPRENTAAYMVGNFKKAAVFASASVVIQQPSSIARAFAEVEPKYFVGEKIDAKTHKETWAEVKKYAPVAIIKEMGYFDTNMGRSSKDYLLAQKYEGWKEKAKALITDGDFRDEVLSKAPALADELAWCGIWNAVKREQALANPTLATSSEEFLEICGKRFTEVIAKTQVYDSVLARSGNMRAKGVFMSMWTAFMGEPTVSVNMMEHAVRKLVKDGDREIFAKTSGAVVSSIVLNSLLVSLVYAMRDDDEESTFIEKYVSRALTEIADGLNPLTYYPGIKDVWSILQGYDVERADMSLISDLTSAMTKAAQLLAKDTTDMSEEELAEHRKKVANSMLSVVDYTTAMFGLPVKNVRRDILAAKNFITTVGKDISERDTSWGSLMDKAWDSVKNTIPVIGLMGDESKADKLYDATVKGDTAYVKRLNSTYSTESSLNSALRKGLRENDPRIREAAIAWNAGNNAKYQQIARDIVAEKHFSQDNIVKAIRAEANALKPE